jgi:hypothetical protein
MKLNHVAVRLPRTALDDPGRSQILHFCADAFGWTEGDNTGERDDPLIMMTGSFGEFVYLARTDEPTTGELDHFGVLVDSIDELEAIARRASAYDNDGLRASVTAIGSRTTKGPSATWTLTSCYITFAPLPTLELQHLTRH